MIYRWTRRSALVDEPDALTERALRAEHRRSGMRYSVVLPTMTNTEMTAGLAPARGLRNAGAAEVADAIVALIAKPMRRITVTRTAGVVLVIQRILPGAVADAVRRAIGLDELFTERVDVARRRSYQERVHGRS